jgi:hypothetical protein
MRSAQAAMIASPARGRRRRQPEHDRNRQGGPERDRRRPANELGRGRAIGQQTRDAGGERLDDGISDKTRDRPRQHEHSVVRWREHTNEVDGQADRDRNPDELGPQRARQPRRLRDGGARDPASELWFIGRRQGRLNGLVIADDERQQRRRLIASERLFAHQACGSSGIRPTRSRPAYCPAMPASHHRR